MNQTDIKNPVFLKAVMDLTMSVAGFNNTGADHPERWVGSLERFKISKGLQPRFIDFKQFYLVPFVENRMFMASTRQFMRIIQGVKKGRERGADEEVIMITGATISSQAVIDIINMRVEELRDPIHTYWSSLAAGDAVGTTLEFAARESVVPIDDMVGGGPFNLQPGEWTDDTSMALCLATSLVACGGFNPRDQMERYVRWMDEGYYSSTGECFDIGVTTSTALHRFERTGEPYSGSTDPHAAGNGSIMRLAPVPMWFYPDLQQAA